MQISFPSVLLVEDENSDQNAFVQDIEKYMTGYRYSVASTIREAEKLLSERTFDVVVADYGPDRKTASDLLTMAGKIPLVIVTGVGTQGIAVNAMTAGACLCLIKDPGGEYLMALSASIERVIQHSREKQELEEYRHNLEELVEQRTAELNKDITARREAEEALIMSENRHRTLIKALPDLIFVIDRNGVIHDFSADDAGKLAVQDRQIIGMNIAEIGFSQEALREIRAAIINAIDENRFIAVEYELPTPSGLLHWEARMAPMPEERVVAVIRDITTRKLSEIRLKRKNEEYAALNEEYLSQNEELKVTIEGLANSNRKLKATYKTLSESEEKFRQLAENTNDVFILRTSDNKILYVSQSFEKVFGRKCEELIENPKNYHSWIHPEDLPHILEVGKKARNTKNFRISIRHRIIRPDGTVRWLWSREHPVYDGNGKLIRMVTIAGDITQEQQMQERVRQSQKLESMGTLAGGIAHDFNNLLTPIQGYAYLLKDELPEGSQAWNDLEQIISASERAKDLINQILTFSRKVDSEPRVFELQPLVREALHLIRSSVPSSVEVRIQLSADPVSISGDPSQIHQMLINLCTNAYQAMEEYGGILDILLDTITADENILNSHPNLSKETEYIRLIVSDTGAGMEKTTAERIFEPFFTTKPKGKGTGLGLSIVHGIVNSLNGEIIVYSEPGEGTSIHVYLPVHKKKHDNTKSNKSEVPRGNGERIVFVDDEHSVLGFGERVLVSLGYNAVVFSGGAEALQYLTENEAELLITDFTMPGMNGLRLSSKVKSLYPDIPVILISGLVTAISQDRLEKSGITKFLTKPFTMEDIGREIAGILSKKATE
ncbi:MAG: PAS domain S-box protein [Bacteroidetes bacterium]|nr:PAS domain S-box protein [Bacteroidota bacterium]